MRWFFWPAKFVREVHDAAEKAADQPERGEQGA
jgi:hypothetical protein